MTELNKTQISVTQFVPIRPRLLHCSALLKSAITSLAQEKQKIRQSNSSQIENNIESEQIKLIQNEVTIIHSLESLEKIQKRLQSISTINQIPTVLSSIIPVIRSVSSNLYELIPAFSQQLNELSSILGGIVFDSATLTGAKFDFTESNSESQFLLDEAKLMAGSKIGKLYPNLDLGRIPTTWQLPNIN